MVAVPQTFQEVVAAAVLHKKEEAAAAEVVVEEKLNPWCLLAELALEIQLEWRAASTHSRAEV